MTGAWTIRHLDLRVGQPELVTGGAPVLAVYWWGGLPLGVQAYLPQELPLRRDQLLALAAGFVAAQLATRGAAPGGNGNGEPGRQSGLAVGMDADVVLQTLERLAEPAQDEAEDLAVIVCTRDRPQALAGCLAHLLAQHRPAGEIVVVDNSAQGSAGGVCRGLAAANPSLRYVHEPRPGLSVARNAGIAASTRPLVAFTDDDVEVHPQWTAELVRAFRVSDADCVTGLVLPAALDSEAQRFFQFELGGFGAGLGCTPVRFDRRFFAETRAYGAPVWRIGAGASMAFRRAIFERIGRFDERLGAGAAGCSEDSELWYRILAAGGVCLYEPRVVAFHHHRADWAGLQRQIRAYLQGHVAALVVQYDRYRDRGNLRRLAWQMPGYFLRTALALLKTTVPYRGRILLAEIRGWAAGLTYLARPRWRTSRPHA